MSLPLQLAPHPPSQTPDFVGDSSNIAHPEPHGGYCAPPRHPSTRETVGTPALSPARHGIGFTTPGTPAGIRGYTPSPDVNSGEDERSNGASVSRDVGALDTISASGPHAPHCPCPTCGDAAYARLLAQVHRHGWDGAL